MKIEWTDELREIPYLGMMAPGKTYIVPDDIGKSLIKQGQAKIYKKKPQRGE